MATLTIIFGVLNFGALAIGGLFTGQGVRSDWYVNLNKAPWTPPGWVFGFAWTLIMVCFTVYMVYLWPLVTDKGLLIGLYSVQWLLNVAWNPTFFRFHKDALALAIITLLTILVGYLMFNYWVEIHIQSLFILPYFVWLLIATSLNAYILFKN